MVVESSNYLATSHTHLPVEVDTVLVPKHFKHPLLKSISVSEQALQLPALPSQPLH